MSIQANKTMIGAFMMGAVALLVLAFVVLGSGRIFKRATNSVLYFDGTLKGLNEGAPVEFRGVKVGIVKEIRLQFLADVKNFRTRVLIETFPGRFTIKGDENKLLKEMKIDDPFSDEARVKFIDYMIRYGGLRAQPALQSFVTGLLMIELDLHENTPLKQVGEDEDLPEIPTLPMPMEEITGSLAKMDWKAISENLQNTVSGLERMVNSEELKAAVKNFDGAMEDIRKVTAEMRENFKPMNEQVEELLKNTNELVQHLNEKVEPLVTGWDESLADVRKLVNTLEEQVDPLAQSLDETLEDTRGLIKNVNERVEPVAARAEEALTAARKALDQASSTLVQLEGLSPEQSALAYEVRATLVSVTDAMNAVKVMASYLERHPEALIHGKSGD
jgi:paraquat-inducible protein B